MDLSTLGHPSGGEFLETSMCFSYPYREYLSITSKVTTIKKMYNKLQNKTCKQRII